MVIGRRIEIIKVAVIYVTFLFFFFFSAYCSEPPISVAVEPSEVGIGGTFEVVVTVKGTNVGIPEFVPVDGVKVGPNPTYTGSSTTVQIVFGSTQITNIKEWRYQGVAEKEGDYYLQVKVKIDGKEYISEPRLLKVSKSVSSSQPVTPQYPYQRRQPSRRSIPSSPSPTSSLIDRAVILESEVSKKLVFQGEVIYLMLRAKILDTPDLSVRTPTGNLPDLPDLSTFFVGKVEQSTKTETIDNYLYRVIELKVPVCPKGVGTFTIPSWVWNASLVYYSTWGWPDTYPIQKDTPPISIEVRPLPDPPPTFYGAVGEFAITSNLSATDVEVGTPIYFTITIAGEGYPEFIKPPELGKLEWGYVSGPELVNARSDLWTEVEKSFKYTISPLKDGEFEISPIEFSYFNPHLGQYAVAKTPLYKVRVKETAGNTIVTAGGTPKLETQKLNVANSELLPLVTEGVKLKPSHKLKREVKFVIILSPPLLASFLFITGWRRQTLLNNPILLKRKNAYKNALKGYEEAKKNMHTILAVENVLKQYIGDILGIDNPLGMTSDEITEALSKKVQNVDTIERIRKILKTCERIRYAGEKATSTAEQIGIEEAFLDVLNALRRFCG